MSAAPRFPRLLLLAVTALSLALLGTATVDAAPASAASAHVATAKRPAHPTHPKAPVLHVVTLKRPARTLATVTPGAGPLAGGTRVVIRGTGFTAASVVTFGTVTATQFVSRSATTLVLFTPPSASGAKKVTVSTSGHVHSVWRGGAKRVVKYRGSKRPVQAAPSFTFQSPPAISAISTSELVPGQRVSITGSFLSHASAVLFGTVKATGLTVVSSNKVTVTVPSAAVGQDDVTVVTPGGASGRPLAAGGSAGVSDAIYDWWSGPTAVEDGPYTWLSSISSKGVIQLSRYDERTGAYRTVSLGSVAPDEHSTPAIALSPDRSSLLVFWTGHISYSYLSYRSVDRTTLLVGPTQRLDFGSGLTYVQFLQNGDTVSVITRVGDTAWGIRTSTDFGTSWGPEGKLLAFSALQSYALLRPAPQPGHYLLAFYGNPKSSDHTIVMADVDTVTGAITGAGGAVVGDLFAPGGPALDPERMEVVHAPETGENVRLLDVGTLGGEPAVLYAEWGTAELSATYRLAVRGASGWQTAPWALPAGQPIGSDPDVNYVGGASFDGNAVYTSRETGGIWALEKWAWDGSDLQSAAAGALMISNRQLVRPTVAVGDGGRDEVLIAVADKYLDYKHYHATIEHVPQL